MKQLITIVFVFISISSFAKTIYVNKAAIGLKDGSSWANAYTELRDVLNTYKAKSGDTIKVAAGTYISTLTDNIDISFPLARGTVMLGGYPASGSPTDAQRDWVKNPTILSAKLNYSGYRSSILVNVAVDTATVLDGFQLRDCLGGILLKNSRNVVVRNVLFEAGASDAISLDNSSALFVNIIINRCAGIRSVLSYNNSNTNFYNTIITNSRSGFVNNNATISIVNCTLTSNDEPPFQGDSGGGANIQNCIFWNNNPLHPLSEDEDISVKNQSVIVSNSITQVYAKKEKNSVFVNTSPRFYNINNPAGADGIFFTADDGLQLTAPCSPALNTGNNNAIAGVSADILGNPRVYNGGVDMGAYEMQAIPSVPQKTVYVNNSKSNTGANNGSSWANAYKTLQQALLYCADTIKVAEGIYLTDNSWADSVFSFESGKVFLGGYPSTGNPSDAERKPFVYKTLLKGNFSKKPSGTTYPVVKCYNHDSTTLIDGFSVVNDYQGLDNTSPVVLVSYYSKTRIENCDFTVSLDSGLQKSGILIEKSSSLIVRKSKFNTYMDNRVGGMGITCTDTSTVVISNCDFTNKLVNGSWSDKRGIGAILLENSTASLDSCVLFNQKQVFNTGNEIGSMIIATNSYLTINDCILKNVQNADVRLLTLTNTKGMVNRTKFISSGSISQIYNNNSSLSFTRCLFDSTGLIMENVNKSAPVFNNCVSAYKKFMINTYSFPTLNSCTIIARDGEQELITNYDSSVLTANNTLFWSKKLAPRTWDINDSTYLYSATHSQISISRLKNCVTRNYGKDGIDGNIVGREARLVQFTDIYGPDGVLMTADDGIRLARCSPALNSGNNSLQGVQSLDALGNQRVVNGIVDIGAYESSESQDKTNTYFVNAHAKGSNNGINWQDAYTQLQSAICNVCADTIRVAAGTYYAATKNKDSSFSINRGMALYGGYSVTGVPTENSRKLYDNPTILNGNLGNSLDSLDNTSALITVEGAKENVIIDGFIVREGVSRSVNKLGGGGLYTYYSNVFVNNCAFIKNSGFQGGAVFAADRTFTEIRNTIFEVNYASSEGGAISGNGDSVKIYNSVFENNSAYLRGGAIKIGGKQEIANCVFYKNYTYYFNTSSMDQGGAINATKAYPGLITNCVFYKNTVPTAFAGGAISSKGTMSNTIRNCIFKSNTAGGYIDRYNADIDWDYSRGDFNSIMQYRDGPIFVGDKNIVADPILVDTLNPRGADGRWFTPDDGLRLNFNSPAINKGDNQFVLNQTDILNNIRIVDTTVDMGAYEYQNRPVANAGKDTVICAGTSIRIGTPADPAHTYKWTSSPAGFVSGEIMPQVTPSVKTTYFLEVSYRGEIKYDTVVVEPLSSIVPEVIISAASTTICKGGAAAFTAVVKGGGLTPSFQWQVNNVNAGTDSIGFVSKSLTDASVVKVIVKSNLSCAAPQSATSNAIAVKVLENVVPSVSISSSPNTVCAGDTAVFRAKVINGGDSPLYRWRGGGNGTIDSVFTTIGLANDDLVFLTVTSTAQCATPATVSSDTIFIIRRTDVASSISIAASSTKICKGTEVTFTAMPVNLGSSPSYQWKINGTTVGTNSKTFSSSTLNDQDLVYVVGKSSMACVLTPEKTSSLVAIKVNPNINPIANIAGLASVDLGKSTVITLTANSINLPVFEWMDSTSTHGWQIITTGINNNTITYKPLKTGDKIRCQLTSTDECAVPSKVFSNTISFTVNTSQQPASNFGVYNYPNPITGNSPLHVDGLKTSDNWQSLEIYGFDGTKKLTINSISGQTNLTIPISNLTQGIYMAVLKNSNGDQAIFKFMKM